MSAPENLKYLDLLKRMLQVSPGSTILLRGHADNINVETFRKQGGESYVRDMAVKAMKLSKERAEEIRSLLIGKYQIAPDRLSTIGRGWEEPASATDHDKNRRVEAQWFTLE